MEGGHHWLLLQSTNCDDDKDLWFSCFHKYIWHEMSIFRLALCPPRITQSRFSGGKTPLLLWFCLCRPWWYHTFWENWICPTAARGGHLNSTESTPDSGWRPGSSSCLRLPWGGTVGKDALISSWCTKLNFLNPFLSKTALLSPISIQAHLLQCRINFLDLNLIWPNSQLYPFFRLRAPLSLTLVLTT